jgi:hypothetical protein
MDPSFRFWCRGYEWVVLDVHFFCTTSWSGRRLEENFVVVETDENNVFTNNSRNWFCSWQQSCLSLYLGKRLWIIRTLSDVVIAANRFRISTVNFYRCDVVLWNKRIIRGDHSDTCCTPSSTYSLLDENCALLGCYAACRGNCLPTFRTTYCPHLQGSRIQEGLSRNVDQELPLHAAQ